MQYEFEQINSDYGTRFSLRTGVACDTEGHREIILRRAEDGWRYVGYFPVTQRGSGQIQVFDLIFERE